VLLGLRTAIQTSDLEEFRNFSTFTPSALWNSKWTVYVPDFQAYYDLTCPLPCIYCGISLAEPANILQNLDFEYIQNRTGSELVKNNQQSLYRFWLFQALTTSRVSLHLTDISKSSLKHIAHNTTTPPTQDQHIAENLLWRNMTYFKY
jgi:hypothetical protein